MEDSIEEDLHEHKHLEPMLAYLQDKSRPFAE